MCVNMSTLFISNIVLCATCLVTLVYYYLTKNLGYWKKKNVASPTPALFFGNTKEIALVRSTFSDHYKSLYESFPNEKIVGFYRMWNPCLLVRDLEVLKHLMIQDFEHFVDRGFEFSTRGLGVNLFNADGDTWRMLRTRFSPIFTSGKLKNMVSLMNGQAIKILNHLDRLVQDSPDVNVYDLLQKFTIMNISCCAFGIEVDIDSLYESDNVFCKIDKLVFTKSFAIDLEFMFPGILKKLNLSIFPRFITNFFSGLVDKVMKERGGVPSGRKDVMDLLLELRNNGEIQSAKKNERVKERTLKITDELMAAQAFVFYAAGSETSASTASLLLHQLALHQDVQQRVYEEVMTVHTTHGEITFESVKDLTYLGQVIDETLRMFPILDPIQRMLCTATYRIPHTDVTIEKGTYLLVSVKGIHHDETIYPNPDKFDPERFSPEEVKKRHPCAYLPFGLGPRNCIGKRFAEMQTRVLLTHLLRRYRVRAGGRTERAPHFDPRRLTLKPTHGVYLDVRPR